MLSKVRDFDHLSCLRSFHDRNTVRHPIDAGVWPSSGLQSAISWGMPTCEADSKRTALCRLLWTARLLSVSTPIILIVSLLPSSAFPQTQSEGVGISANELVRKVVANELKSQNEDHEHWMYRLERRECGKKQSQEILETNDGSLSRLLSIAGHPLDAAQQRKEDERLQSLVSHPDEQRKLQQASSRKAEQGARLFENSAGYIPVQLCGSPGELGNANLQPQSQFPTAIP